MKYLYVLAIIATCFLTASCSKKGNPAPIPHTIKITASGTSPFTVTVSSILSTAVTATVLDTKTVSTGSYEFTTMLSTDDVVHLEIQTMSENIVSYNITDNGAAGAQQTDKEMSSFTKVTADYTVK